jgi:hypothetical protein
MGHIEVLLAATMRRNPKNVRYVNIQDDGGKAKAYQVKQVLAAIAKLGG